MVGSDPPSSRILGEIRRRIITGELRAGDRVPSTRQIVQRWGVAMATATKVLTTLRQEGLVEPKSGVGTVVATPSNGGTRRRDAREPELTRGRVVRAAIMLADTEGLTALSMRRVATELGVSTMSLYRHVPGKAELVVLMADAVFGEIRFPQPGPTAWRARMELGARLQWATYLRHPWLVQVLSVTGPLPAPNSLAHTEWMLHAVDGLGLDPSTMLYVAITMFSHVRGTAVNLESEAESRPDAQAPILGALADSGRFPTFRRVTVEDFDFDLDTLFEFGLARLLDGFAVFLDRS